MPRPATWLSRTPGIFEEIAQSEEGRTFAWRDVAALFGIERREASRILARAKPNTNSSANSVERSQLLEWLRPIKETFEQQQKQAAERTRKLAEAEAQRQARRAAFRERFGTAPPSWTLTAELESAAVSSLPAGVGLGPGKIEIKFAPDNPIAACELLHALSKAMEHDWFRFCALIAPQAVEAATSSEESIATFLNELEQQRSEGSDLD